MTLAAEPTVIVLGPVNVNVPPAPAVVVDGVLDVGGAQLIVKEPLGVIVGKLHENCCAKAPLDKAAAASAKQAANVRRRRLDVGLNIEISPFRLEIHAELGVGKSLIILVLPPLLQPA